MFIRALACLFMAMLPLFAVGQIMRIATLDTMKTTTAGHVGVGGYIDSYYGYNFSKPADGTTPYFVSSAQHNDFTINLAYVEVHYSSTNLRAKFTPGFGAYMNANYQNEPGTLKSIVEANIGVLLSAKRKIWIDAGVLVSPFTNETAISKNHMMYTRSFAPENVPYYLSGAKLSVPLSEKVNAHLYVVNGWQVIQDNNGGKSVITQVEYRPSKTMLFNWNVYVGDERSAQHPDFRTRYFNDFYWVYKGTGKFSATSSFYFGYQQNSGAPTNEWWQVNFIGQYAFNDVVSLAGRLEHFVDPGSVTQTSITGVPGFRASGAGACLNFKVHHSALFRFEARQFISKDNVKIWFCTHYNFSDGGCFHWWKERCGCWRLQKFSWVN